MLLPALLCLAASSDALAPPPVVDLGRNAIRFEATAALVAYLVPESTPGEPDLNGDGDRLDRVLFVADPQTGAATNLGLACDLLLEAEGTRAAVLVHEAHQGQVDRNGDGDALDHVVHVVEAGTTLAVTNLGLAATAFRLRESALAFGVVESDQGGNDLNADGDAGDVVLHVLDLASMQVRSAALATGVWTYDVGATHAAFLVPEALQGQADRNGDGDASDAVLHTLDLATGAVANLRLATTVTDGLDLDGRALLFRAWEVAQGADLNGDGDQTDAVLHATVLPAGPVANLGLATVDFVQRRGRVAFRVREADQGGQDLNGDGDALDSVLHVGSVGGAGARNLGLAARGYSLAGGILAFRVPEPDQGADLDGDGDAADLVAHLFDLKREIARNLRLPAAGVLAGPREVLVRASEAALGSDLNSDGDAADFVLHVWDVAGGAIKNLGVATPGGDLEDDPDLELEGRRLAFLRDEIGESRDLNADGDALDAVVHVADLDDGGVANLRRASLRSGTPPALRMRGGILVFRLNEAGQGATDQNADGDATDDILHLARVDG